VLAALWLLLATAVDTTPRVPPVALVYQTPFVLLVLSGPLDLSGTKALWHEGTPRRTNRTTVDISRSMDH
jgi:hypothetical protein